MVRIKRRYLVVRFLYPKAPSDYRNREIEFRFHQPTPDNLTVPIFLRSIRSSIEELFGDYGSGVVANNLSVKYLSNPTSTAVVCVSRDHFRLVWAALSLMNGLPKPINQECVIRVIKVSGTIRKALEWLVMNSKEHIASLNTKTQTENGRALLTGISKDIDAVQDELNLVTTNNLHG